MTADTGAADSDAAPGVSTFSTRTSPERSESNECECIDCRALNSSQMVAAV
jgi:hypothetical protein